MISKLLIYDNFFLIAIENKKAGFRKTSLFIQFISILTTV
jgi:hypothetical protein